MRLDAFRSERDRRTATVIEILRRRAALRRAPHEAVPAALRETIAGEAARSRRSEAGPGVVPRSGPR